MGFFDETLDARALLGAPGEYRNPDWTGPPPNVQPADPALRAVMARTESIAVWLSIGPVYSAGTVLTLDVRWRFADRVPTAPNPGRTGRNGLCFGLQFADGSRILPAEREPRRASQRPRLSRLTPILMQSKSLQFRLAYMRPFEDRTLRLRSGCRIASHARRR
jgi:hypothetical protein